MSIDTIEFSRELEVGNVLKIWSNNRRIYDIQRLYGSLVTDERVLSSLPGVKGPFDQQTVSKALRGSKNKLNCLRLCHLASIAGYPSICELGTNLGLSSAYLGVGASANCEKSYVRTGDISGVRIRLAKELHHKLKVLNVEYFVGDLLETIDLILQRDLGLCFIDALHTYDATMFYFKKIRPCMKSGGGIVFDDINWSSEMKEAWFDITKSEKYVSVWECDGVGYLQVE